MKIMHTAHKYHTAHKHTDHSHTNTSTNTDTWEQVKFERAARGRAIANQIRSILSRVLQNLNKRKRFILDILNILTNLNIVRVSLILIWRFIFFYEIQSFGSTQKSLHSKTNEFIMLVFVRDMWFFTKK